MDGIHDMGGRQGFGPVRYTPDAKVFHAPWEIRVNSLYGFAVRAGVFNMDEYRHAIERMAPVHYLAAPYYERTLTAVASLLVEKGVVTAETLAARAGGTLPLSRPIGPGRTSAPAQNFAIGEQVRVKNEFTSGHTRMPGYIRGKMGVVVAISPPYPFPDAAGHGMAETWEPTYDVRFRSEELWPDSSDKASVHVGVFQSYLEKV